MICFLRGRVAATASSTAVIDVGGVGYRVTVSAGTCSRLPSPGGEAMLHTFLCLRDDGMELFGFAEPEEARLFETLLKVTGVGPRLAMSVLSALKPRDFMEAVLLEDVTALTRAPGVGRKTAQRLVLELKEKLAHSGAGAVLTAPGQRSGSDRASEVVEALMALGYARAEAGRALERAARDLGAEAEASALLKASLKHL
ncbi:MAG TPA: Holliday junction branch migration protein RuvA [Clostridiales bacterium]|nr:Holliday junction branch migration protein RuvA [Clostridiales bacterium]